MSDMYRDSIFWVEVDRIKPNPFQPRREFNQSKLQELSESIRMYGLLQPLTVTRKEISREDGGISVEYELIAGERRLRASKLAGLQQIPVIIRSGEDDDRVKLELAIIENLQREDLNPVDRAHAFNQLHKNFGFTHAQIGKKMGKSREYVSNTVRLLTLPEAILVYISEGRITEGHTRPLLMLNKKPEEQLVLAKEILLKKLTVRESEEIARRSAQDRVKPRHRIAPEILSMERALTEKLGTRVTIEPREVGGRLVISFFSADDLQALLESMRMEEERTEVTDVFDGTLAEEGVQQGAVPHPEDVQPETVASQESVEEVAATPEVFVVEEPVLSAAPTESAPEEERESESTTMLNTLVQALTGTASTETEPEPVTSPEPTVRVEPSADMPMPESVPVAVPEPEKKEDDADLYSLRNFSI
jgi:ParB family chromosome partitioning protein